MISSGENPGSSKTTQVDFIWSSVFNVAPLGCKCIANLAFCGIVPDELLVIARMGLEDRRSSVEVVAREVDEFVERVSGWFIL